MSQGSPSSQSSSFQASSLQCAPRFSLPSCSIVSVEHPFIITNISRGVQSLGGAARLEELFGEEKIANPELFIHPSDAFGTKITAGGVNTNNLLLRITVPKATGRKRKSGSDGPYEAEATSKKNAGRRAPREVAHLLQALHDMPGKTDTVALGSIEKTFRFRNLPDFVYSTARGPFARIFRETIVPMNYERAKDFKFDMLRGSQATSELIPPPVFTHMDTHFNYSYRQNPAMKQTIDAAGNIITVNDQKPTKLFAHRIAYDCMTVPTEPRTDVLPIDFVDEKTRELIEQVRSCLEERPIWTRRGLSNRIRSKYGSLDSIEIPKPIYQYVAFMFRSGPWRDAIIKFGVDPRSHPKYRIYQTIVFQMEDAEKQMGKAAMRSKTTGKHKRQTKLEATDDMGVESHIFDGYRVGKDGKLWQICDIHDPQVQPLLATDNLRKDCDLLNTGWYHNGTWAKARLITKAKMVFILSGKGRPRSVDYERAIALPEVWSEETKDLFHISKHQATAEEVELVGAIRNVAKSFGGESLPPSIEFDEIVDSDDGDVPMENSGGEESAMEDSEEEDDVV